MNATTALGWLESRVDVTSLRAAVTASEPASGATLPIGWKQAMDAFDPSEAVARILAPVPRDTGLGTNKRELLVFSRQTSPFERET